MKTTSLVMLVAAAISALLLLALPQYSAAAGDSIQQQIVSKEREELDSLKTGNLEVFAICSQMTRCLWTHTVRQVRQTW